MLGRRSGEIKKEQDLILVDTSVWIDLFNHPDSPYAKRLKGLIEEKYLTLFSRDKDFGRIADCAGLKLL